MGIISKELAGIIGGLISGIGGLGKSIELIETKGKGFAGLISKINGVIGAVTAGVTILSGIGKLLKKLFGGDGVGEAIDRERQMIDITEEMEKKIRELEKSLGDTHAATSMLMNEIISQAEINLQNFDSYAQRTRDILADLDCGTLSISQTTEAIGKAFNELLAAAQRLGTEGTKKMIEIIGDVRSRGLEVAEIQEYVNKKLESGVKALETYLSTFASVGNIKDDIASLMEKLNEGGKEAERVHEELAAKQLELARAMEDVASNWDFIQTAAMSTFHALEQEGHSFIEITKMMGGQLNSIAQMAVDNGLQIHEGLKAMTNLSSFIQQNQDLVNRIDATQKIMEALGDTAFMTEKDFSSFASQAVSQFEDIMKRTEDQEMALRLIGPALEDLIKYSESYGFAIDDNAQALIDLAQKEGVLQAERMSLQEKQLLLMEEIVKCLGGKIPYAMDSMEERVLSSMDRIQGQTHKWQNSLEKVENQFADVGKAVINLDKIVEDKMTGHSMVPKTYELEKAFKSVSKAVDAVGKNVIDLDKTANIFGKNKDNFLKQKTIFEAEYNFIKPPEVPPIRPPITRTVRSPVVSVLSTSQNKSSNQNEPGGIHIDNLTFIADVNTDRKTDNPEELGKALIQVLKENKCGFRVAVVNVTKDELRKRGYYV
jgi:hypothetical protein